MGDRANYAIVHRGKMTVYYAHWGGPTVPRELQRGPAACERFIRTQERVRDKSFLDFSYMEGAIALDKDKKRAMVFGGPGSINYDPAVQARMLERLRPIWQSEGWTIEWARRYAYDLFEFLGLPGTMLESDFFLGEPAAWEDALHGSDWTAGLACRNGSGVWEVRGVKQALGCLVHHGNRILESFDELPTIAQLDALDASGISALLFDEPRQAIVIVSPMFAGLNAPHCLVERVRKAFPSWAVELDLDLLPPVERLRARGIDITVATDSNADEGEAGEPLAAAEIDQIIDHAFAYQPEAQIEQLTEAAEGMIAEIVASAEAEGHTVQVIQNFSGGCEEAY
jgi:hypothetical protein